MADLYCSRSQRALEEELFREAAARLKNIRSGASAARRVIIVVPAQFTLEAERRAFEALGGDGFFDLHIMSGNKLEHEIMRETGGPGVTPVNGLGRLMLLRRGARALAPELAAFGRICDKPGFLDLAGDFIVQMKQSGVSAAELPGIAEKLPEGMLRTKLGDMAKIAADYEKSMEGRFTDSEDLLAFVAGRAAGSEYIAQSELLYYGFYSFTLNELSFLASLAARAAGFGIFLLKGDGSPEDAELFAAPERTAELLKRELSLRRVRYRERTVKDSAGRSPTPLKVSVCSCATGSTQADTIAVSMLEDYRRGMGFGEMAVLTADDDGLKDTLRERLARFGIPVFADEKRRVTDDAAVRFCSALLDMAAGDPGPGAFLTALKSGIAAELLSGAEGLPEDFTRAADDLENYSKLYHMRLKRFFSPLKYGRDRYSPERFSDMEALRGAAAGLFSPFLESFSKAADCRGMCGALCSYLESIGLPDVLSRKALELSESGMQDAAEETAQSWNALMQVLDQAAELLGDAALSADEFRETVEGSLADIKIGLLPQGENSVQLGSVGRSRLSGVRALYIADMNEGVIPPDGEGDALITRSEAEELAGIGVTLIKDSELTRSEAVLQLRLLMEEPSEKLWLGFRRSGKDGEAAAPSRALTEAAERYGVEIEEDISSSASDLPYLQGIENSLSRVAQGFRESLDEHGGLGYASEDLKFAYNELLETTERAGYIAGALSYGAPGAALGPQLAARIYRRGDGEFSFSPSQLERFSSCPFMHYVSYGLRPEEERSFDIDYATVGSIHHEAVMELSKRLSEKAVSEGIAMTDPASLWMTVTDGQLKDMLSGILSEIAENRFEILRAGAAEDYRSGRILRTCLAFARRMVANVRAGRVSDMYFESGFGRGRRFPAIEVETAAGKVYVEGRIDRVDIMRTERGDYVNVIDYKSGSQSFDRKKIESGLSLQLMTYLEGASSRENSVPAGVFYFRIKDVTGSAGSAELLSGQISEKLAAAIEDSWRMDGVLVDEPGLVELVDGSIAEGGRSSVFNAAYDSKTGGYKGKGLISREEMDELRASLASSLSRICGGITAGELSVRPAKISSSQTACANCAYADICLKGLRG